MGDGLHRGTWWRGGRTVARTDWAVPPPPGLPGGEGSGLSGESGITIGSLET